MTLKISSFSVALQNNKADVCSDIDIAIKPKGDFIYKEEVLFV